MSQQVKFTLEDDPQEYTLTFDFNEIADAEEVCGCNLLAVVGNPASATAKQFRGLLYACLKAAHPLVLLKEAGDLMSRDSETVSQALGQVVSTDRITATEQAATQLLLTVLRQGSDEQRAEMLANVQAHAKAILEAAAAPGQ